MTRSAMPILKVWCSLFAGGATATAVWLLHTFVHVDIPADVAAFLTLGFSVLAAYIAPLLPQDIADAVPLAPPQPPAAPAVVVANTVETESPTEG
jgi:hypothetical protein